MPAGIRQHVLIGMGNPLLDIQVNVDKSLLEKYGLNENGAILAEEKHMPLFNEIVNFPVVEYIPGGATQNTLRVFQWIVGKPEASSFFGAVGSDKYSQLLHAEALKAGVNVQYQVNPTIKTGTCASLIHNHNRSLVADLAAANTFTPDHLWTPNNQALIEEAQIYYISGFFLTVCPAAIQNIAEHALKTNKTFCMNLAAPFIPSFFSDPLNKALPYVDILFANDEEACLYAEKHDFGTKDLVEIGHRLANFEKENKERPRLVIITQGPNSIITIYDGKDCEFSIPKIENIVDTNGAGDAFCGGFLAERINGSELETCIKCGVYAAGIVVQHQGCTFPKKCDYILKTHT